MLTRRDAAEAALRDLLDRAAIREVLARYCRAADRCDEELLRSCYHRDALDRHGRFAGPAGDFASWVIRVQRTSSITTQHAVLNVVIELAGPTAWVESAFMATHVRPAACLDELQLLPEGERLLQLQAVPGTYLADGGRLRDLHAGLSASR